MHLINEAKEVLLDEQKRREYDLQLSSSAAFDGADGFDWDDMGFSDEDFSDEGFLSPDPSMNTSSGPSHARKSKKTRKRRARKSKMKKSRSGRSSQQPKCQ